MQDTDPSLIDPPAIQVDKGRRRLLKALAATGGAVTAASLLPGKWTEPTIEMGLLPVHAQTSNVTISNLNIGIGTVATGQDEASTLPISGSFDYSDPLGGVNGNTVVKLSVTLSSLANDDQSSGSFERTFSALGAPDPDPFSGTVEFTVNVPLEDLSFTDGIEVSVSLFIQTDDGRPSNTLTQSFAVAVLSD